jgi:hypothetical protein
VSQDPESPSVWQRDSLTRGGSPLVIEGQLWARIGGRKFMVYIGQTGFWPGFKLVRIFLAPEAWVPVCRYDLWAISSTRSQVLMRASRAKPFRRGKQEKDQG